MFSMATNHMKAITETNFDSWYDRKTLVIWQKRYTWKNIWNRQSSDVLCEWINKNAFQYDASTCSLPYRGLCLGVSVQGVSVLGSLTRGVSLQKEHGTRDRITPKEHGTRQPDRKWHHTENPSPVKRMMHASKNINLPQTLFAGGN